MTEVIIAGDPAITVVLVIPVARVREFQEMVARGMNFGQYSPELHRFADKLRELVPPATPLPGTMLL